jgi:hypothetical protein
MRGNIDPRFYLDDDYDDDDDNYDGYSDDDAAVASDERLVEDQRGHAVARAEPYVGACVGLTTSKGSTKSAAPRGQRTAQQDTVSRSAGRGASAAVGGDRSGNRVGGGGGYSSASGGGFCGGGGGGGGDGGSSSRQQGESIAASQALFEAAYGDVIRDVLGTVDNFDWETMFNSMSFGIPENDRFVLETMLLLFALLFTLALHAP